MKFIIATVFLVSAVTILITSCKSNSSESKNETEIRTSAPNGICITYESGYRACE